MYTYDGVSQVNEEKEDWMRERRVELMKLIKREPTCYLFHLDEPSTGVPCINPSDDGGRPHDHRRADLDGGYEQQ